VTNDRDVIQALEAWLNEGLPTLPDRAVDAALEEAEVTRQRRGNWFERTLPTQRGLLRFSLAAAPVIVIMLIGVTLLFGGNPIAPGGPPASSGTAAPSASASQRPTPTPAEPKGKTADLYGMDISAGFIGLPPLWAEPSEFADGTLVDTWPVRCCGLPYRGSAQLYADGRLIWNMYYGPGNSYSTGYLEQRLTPAGVDLLQAEVDRRKKDPARLAEWLPASAWADQEIRAYVPRSYAACVHENGPELQTATPVPLGDVLELLPPDARELLRGVDRREDGAWEGWECRTLTTQDARLLDAYLRLAGFGQDPGVNQYLLQYQQELPPRNLRLVEIWFEPVFPDGSIGCSACG